DVERSVLCFSIADRLGFRQKRQVQTEANLSRCKASDMLHTHGVSIHACESCSKGLPLNNPQLLKRSIPAAVVSILVACSARIHSQCRQKHPIPYRILKTQK
ncbi:unnamed protein product, partial [Ectocarpus sp. 13 AM-2016]